MRALQIKGVDPRALVTQVLRAPDPLPYVSRRALARVRDRLDPPECCDQCGGTVHLVNNCEVYRGTSYGDWPYAYLCDECGAYVGLHPGTDLPLGTMADAVTREARKHSKREFEELQAEGFPNDRGKAYRWLAGAMGLDRRLCHFGLFTEEQCEQASRVISEERRRAA